jgi:DHA2 family multidrug resistance protein
MSSVACATPSSARTTNGVLLMVGIVLATLTEAIASTVLALGRSDIIGDTYAAWRFRLAGCRHIAFKLIGFADCPLADAAISYARNVIIGATLVMGLASCVAAVTARLELLIALRILQGFAGGALLVAGQAIIFRGYPRALQPVLQALFAMAAVVASATLAPALQGWLIDSQSWTWIFFSVVPLALAAICLLLIADHPVPAAGNTRLTGSAVH